MNSIQHFCHICDICTVNKYCLIFKVNLIIFFVLHTFIVKTRHKLHLSHGYNRTWKWVLSTCNDRNKLTFTALHALTIGERVRTPRTWAERVNTVVYVYMTIARGSFVVSTYNSPPKQRTIHAHSLKWRVGQGLTHCATVSVTCVFSAFATSYSSVQKKTQRTLSCKTRTDNTGARQVGKAYVWAANQIVYVERR